MSLRIHTVYNLAGQLAPLAVSLATIPSYLGTIGETRYGVLAIAWLLISYLGLLDLGLGTAAAQRLSALGTAQPAQTAKVFWTALLTTVMLALPAVVIAWPAAHALVAHGLPMSDDLRAELLDALGWMVAAVPVVTVSSVLTGALQSHERFLELSVASVISAVGVQVLPLLAALALGPHIGVLLPAVLFGRLLASAYLWRCCLRHVARGHPPCWRQDIVRDLLRFGGWASVTAVVGPIMVVADRFAIGALLGPRAVSQYTIPFQLAERSTVLAGALNSALMPSLARASSQAERDELALRALHLLAVLISPLFGTAMVLIGPFLGWWVGPEMAANSTRVAQMLLAGFWINSLAFVPYTLLQATGRPDVVARCHLTELAPYLALLFAGLHFGGMLGAAMAFTLRVLADFLLLAHFAAVLARVRVWLLPGIALVLMACVETGPVAWVACALIWGWSALRTRAALGMTPL